jgi:uncharacterized protein (DUF58 family)
MGLLPAEESEAAPERTLRVTPRLAPRVLQRCDEEGALGARRSRRATSYAEGRG